MVSPVLVAGHALLVNWARKLLGVGEDVVVVQDDRFDDLIDVRLAGHLVKGVGRRQQGGAEHDGQVPGVHHVLIAVLGEAVGTQRRTFKKKREYLQTDTILPLLHLSSII